MPIYSVEVSRLVREYIQLYIEADTEDQIYKNTQKIAEHSEFEDDWNRDFEHDPFGSMDIFIEHEVEDSEISDLSLIGND